MVRFSRVRLAVCPMCHPQVIRSRWLRGYHGGDVLKYQESCEGFKALPLNWVECGTFSTPSGTRRPSRHGLKGCGGHGKRFGHGGQAARAFVPSCGHGPPKVDAALLSERG